MAHFQCVCACVCVVSGVCITTTGGRLLQQLINAAFIGAIDSREKKRVVQKALKFPSKKKKKRTLALLKIINLCINYSLDSTSHAHLFTHMLVLTR